MVHRMGVAGDVDHKMAIVEDWVRIQVEVGDAVHELEKANEVRKTVDFQEFVVKSACFRCCQG